MAVAVPVIRSLLSWVGGRPGGQQPPEGLGRAVHDGRRAHPGCADRRGHRPSSRATRRTRRSSPSSAGPTARYTGRGRRAAAPRRLKRPQPRSCRLSDPGDTAARVGRLAWRPPPAGCERAVEAVQPLLAAHHLASEMAGTVSGTELVQSAMATNLRLGADAEEALRREAERTGRSQQELIREAVDRYLGLAGNRPPTSDRDVVVTSGLALPARRAYEELEELVRLPDGADDDRAARPRRPRVTCGSTSTAARC